MSLPHSGEDFWLPGLLIMMLFALLMVFLASPPNIVLKVVEVKVWAAVPQLPLAPWFLQFWKCHMP